MAHSDATDYITPASSERMARFVACFPFAERPEGKGTHTKTVETSQATVTSHPHQAGNRN
ncbi:hypothetical protein [Nostoc sp.]|uniref:hypothetical protein n=1 Tax=Nostoc sp. TaxID=1180 RepID=UPI002FFC2C81